MAAEPTTDSPWRGRWLPITVGVLALITLTAFEANATATVMPAVAEELNVLAAYTWAFNAYVLASLLGMVAAGIGADARGPRLVMLNAIAALAIGSILVGVAWDLVSLIAGRALQGLGGGALIVSVYVVVARGYPDSMRPRAMLVVASGWVLPSLIGPVIAGVLTEQWTWRAAFWLVPLFVIPPLLLLWRGLRSLDVRKPTERAGHRLRAGLIATAGLVAIQDGFGRAVGASGATLGAVEILLGIVALGYAARVLLPAGTLRFVRGLPCTVMMRGILASAFFSAEVFVPLAFVEVRGLTVTQGGLLLAVSGACWVAGSFTQSRQPISLPRSRLVMVGGVIVAAGLFTLPISLLGAVPPWCGAVSWSIAAYGMGLAIPSIAVQTMRLSPEADQGRNSSALQIVDSVLVVIVTAGLGVIHSVAVTTSQGADAGTFVIIWAVAALIALVGAALARRMEPVTT